MRRSSKQYRPVVASGRAGVLLALTLVLVLILAACSGGAATESAVTNAGSSASAVEPAAQEAAVDESAAESPDTPVEATAAPVEEPTTAPAEEPAEAPAQEASAPSGAGMKACDVLTAADAEAFLGAAPAAPESPIEGEGNFYVTSCKYEAGDAYVTLILSEAVTGKAETAMSFFTTDRTHAAENYGVEPVDVPGLGEAAFWLSSPDGYLNDIETIKGMYRVGIGVSGDPSPEPPAALLALAQTVLGRLP